MLHTQGTQAAPAAARTAGGHDVRDEIFDIVRPTGWTTEVDDPAGALRACVHGVRDEILALMSVGWTPARMDTVHTCWIHQWTTEVDDPADTLVLITMTSGMRFVS